MERLMQIANQMDQPGQIHRAFFRSCFGVCKGLFALADPVKNVVGRIRTRLNREFGRFQRIIDVMPFRVVVGALPSAQVLERMKMNVERSRLGLSEANDFSHFS